METPVAAAGEASEPELETPAEAGESATSEAPTAPAAAAPSESAASTAPATTAAAASWHGTGPVAATAADPAAGGGGSIERPEDLALRYALLAQRAFVAAYFAERLATRADEPIVELTAPAAETSATA